MNSISTGNPLQELARQLVQKFDTDRDGQLTTQEFTSFLTNFLGTFGGGKTAAAAGTGLAQGYQVPATTSEGVTGGRGGGYAYGGFDFSQPAANRDITKSAKYAFAEATRLAEEQGAGTMWHTKAGAEQFARQYVQPFLERQGFAVHEIVGDKMRVSTRENPAGEWVDFVENVDGANPRLAWQSDGAGQTQFAPH